MIIIICNLLAYVQPEKKVMCFKFDQQGKHHKLSSRLLLYDKLTVIPQHSLHTNNLFGMAIRCAGSITWVRKT
ncbi:hypothetical protein Hanom_Chr10g00899901 [Helianthus anomalus]